MKHENEIVDGKLVMRVVCGVLAAAGLVVGPLGAIKHGLEHDWFGMLYRLSLLFSTWWCGYFALTGRFPIKRDRDGNLVRDRSRDRT